MIGPEDVSRFLTKKPSEEPPFLGLEGDSLKEAKRSFEREFLRRNLAVYEGNISKTAQAVGVERSYLYKKLKSLDLIDEKE